MNAPARPSVVREPLSVAFANAVSGSSTRPLTDRQRAIVRFIREGLERDCIPPTLREIARALAIHSTNGVNDHLTALVKKGYLRKGEIKSRALILLRDEEGRPWRGVSQLSKEADADVRRLLRRLHDVGLPGDVRELVTRCRRHFGEDDAS